MRNLITKRLLLAASVLFLFSENALHAALNGTYTINSGAAATGTNYTSVSAAVSDLMTGTRTDGGPVNGPGVSGPVTLRIVAGSGPYTEQISFGAITGTNATNYVRLTGGSTRETIQYSNTTTTDRHVIRLTGTKNIILDSLTLINTGTTYGYGVWITNNADSNYVQNCRIMVDSTTTSANFAGVTISAGTPTTTGNNGDYNTIQGNMISGGYYGMTVYGTSTTVYGEQNHVINNEIRSFYYYGLRHYMQNAGIIRGNIIHGRPTSTTAAYGLYIYYNKDFICERNRIYDVGTYRLYTAYTNYLGSVIGGTSHIRNNFIGGSNINTGTTYGIYMTTNSYNNNVYHNSVSITAGDGRSLYILSGSGNNVRNNSFSITNSTAGYAAYVSSTAYISAMDYNNYYAPGSSNFIYVGAAYTQGNYQGGGGYNANSRDGDPNYVNPNTDLHAFAAQLFDGGDPSVGVTNDYDGDLRPHPFSSIPDIGGDEYLPDSIDLSSIALVAPGSNLCPDSQQVVLVILSNKGLNTISNIPVTANITGAGSATLSVVHPGPMALGATDTVNLGTFNTWPGGTFNFEVFTAVPGDQSPENDTLLATRSISLTPAPPAASGDTLCAGDSTSLVATSTGTNYWYDAPMGGTLLANGDTLHTGPLSSTTSYYVEAKGVAAGSITTTFANNNSCGGGNMFDVTAYNEITIDSFDLNMSAGTVNVDVYYKVGGFAGFETNAGAWTLLGSGTATSTGTGVPTRLTVGGLTIPAGQTYSIYIYNTSTVYTTLGTPTNYTNSDINVLCGVGLCSLFGGTNNPRGWNGTVYYTAEGCASQRTEVSVNVNPTPVVSVADTTQCGPATLDAGNGGMGASYSWSNGDTTQTTVASGSGIYSVTVSLGMCSASDSASVTINAIPAVNLGNDTTLCTGATRTLDAGSHAGASFGWSTGDTTQTIVVSTAGTYFVDVTSADGCLGSDSIVIAPLAAPQGSISFDTTGCPTIAFTGNELGGAPRERTWYFGDGGTGVGSSTSHTYAANGTYTVSYVQENECGIDSVTTVVTISCLVGTTAPNGTQILLYPNPTQGKVSLHIDLPIATEARISLMDLQGKVITTQSQLFAAGNNVVQLDLGKLSAGVYMVQVITDGLHWQSRLVKE